MLVQTVNGHSDLARLPDCDESDLNGSESRIPIACYHLVAISESDQKDLNGSETRIIVPC